VTVKELRLETSYLFNGHLWWLSRQFAFGEDRTICGLAWDSHRISRCEKGARYCCAGNLLL